MDTIIVATDLSDRSDRAVDRALHLAEASGATCHVVSVVDDALPVELSKQLSTGVEEHIQSALETQKSSVKVEVTILRGDVAEMLIRFAHLHDADLIVLGLHRRRTFLDSMRETTMTRIVAASPTPVLLVKNDVTESYAKALVPVSFSPSCAGAFKSAAKTAPGAKITGFHALHIPFRGLTGGEDSDMARAVMAEAEQARENWMKEQGLGSDVTPPEIIPGAVRIVFDQKIREEKPDLLAVGAHTRSGLAIQKLGGFAAELVRDPPVDLLISHPPRG